MGKNKLKPNDGFPDDEQDISIANPCPRCGKEMVADGDGYLMCAACGFHETDEAEEVLERDPSDEDDDSLPLEERLTVFGPREE